MAGEQDYLKAILAMVARQAFPPDRLAEMVTSNSGGERQIAAYNLCDGDHTQSQIASAARLDKGNLSRSISRWIELGIVIRTGNGSEQKPVHVYRLPSEYVGKKVRKNGKRV